MEASEQTRFDALCAQHLRALKLQGKAEATVDGYARAVRPAAGYFDRCPDQLSSSAMVISYRRSTLRTISRH